MIMKYLQLSTLTACLIQAPLLYAASGWTDYARVAELTPQSRHYYEFQLQLNENPDGCKNKTGFYQDYASPGSDKMFHTLLAAVKSDKRVRVYVTGVCNLGGYSELSSVSIVP